MTEIQTGTVARYCKPSTLDENHYPTDSSFQLRKERNEKYLSVYLLEFFKRVTEKEKVFDVKTEMEKKNFVFKQSGVFALVDIEESKKYIFQKVSEIISYKELNLPHCGIFHEYHEDLIIAELLSQCVKASYRVKSLE